MGRRGVAWWWTSTSVVLSLLVAPDALAAVEVQYETELFSRYVWRGITLTEGPVLQPSVTIAHDSGISLELWGNVDLSDDNDTQWQLNETRIAIDYSRRLGGVEIGAGLIEYLFPNTPFPGTRELHLRVEIEATVSPRLEVYYDFKEVDGAYARLALTYRRELGPVWRLALEASAGYADAAFAIGDKAGPHDGGVEARLERRAGALELSLLAGWTDTLDSEVLPDPPASSWAGLTLGYRF